MKPIQFILVDIKILRSEVRDHPIVFSEEFSLDDILLDVESKFNYEENFVQNFAHFQFLLKQKEHNIVLGHFDIVFSFDVTNLKKILKDADSKKALQLNILALSYSTSRGIIFSETKGFAIHEIYLGTTSSYTLYHSLIEEGSDKAKK